MASYKTKMTLEQADKLAKEFIACLPSGTKVEIAGSIRRKMPEVGDIDLIMDYDLAKLASIPNTEIKESGDKRTTLLYKGEQINIYKAESTYWGSMLFYLTGPAGYSIAYRKKAKVMNWHLDQYGLLDQAGKMLASSTEEDIYKAFGKSWKAPELRGK